jgi:hypothetical protein
VISNFKHRNTKPFAVKNNDNKPRNKDVNKREWVSNLTTGMTSDVEPLQEKRDRFTADKDRTSYIMENEIRKKVSLSEQEGTKAAGST